MGGDSSGGKYACVKCSATVNASRDAILKLFEDNTRYSSHGDEAIISVVACFSSHAAGII